jgi:DNA-binding CsgD family transcriptional regulator
MLVAALDKETRVIWTTRLYGLLDCLDLPPLDGVKLIDCIDNPRVLELAMTQVTVHKKRIRVRVVFAHRYGGRDYHLEMHPLPDNREVAAILFGFAQPPEGNLNHLDREVIFLLARDCTVKRIGELLGRTERAIESRLKQLKEKLGCETVHGLMAHVCKNELL